MNPFRKILCFLGMCPCKPNSDETGCWGECVYCGKRFGFIDRKALRAFADAEIDRHLQARRLQETHPPAHKPIPTSEHSRLLTKLNETAPRRAVLK